MVLSAKDLGIRDNLDPVFCSHCGNRIGWSGDMNSISYGLYCEDCAKLPQEEIEDE